MTTSSDSSDIADDTATFNSSGLSSSRLRDKRANQLTSQRASHLESTSSHFNDTPSDVVLLDDTPLLHLDDDDLEEVHLHSFIYHNPFVFLQ